MIHVTSTSHIVYAIVIILKIITKIRLMSGFTSGPLFGKFIAAVYKGKKDANIASILDVA